MNEETTMSEVFSEEVTDDNHGTAFKISIEQEKFANEEAFYRLVLSILPQYDSGGNSATILKFDGIDDGTLILLGNTFAHAGYQLRELLRDKDPE